MTEFNEQETEFSRLLREVPFDDVPDSEHRQSLRERALAEYDRERSADAARPAWKHAFKKGREIMRRPIPRLMAVTTACLAIAAVWMLVPGGQTTAEAFNKFAEALVAAKTARFQMETHIEGQPRQTFQAWFLAPGKYRQELPGMYNITDVKAGKIMNVIPAEKKVLLMIVKGEPKEQGSSDYFEKLRELLGKTRDAKEDRYERLGEKEIDGKRAVGFQLDSPAASVTLWGDAATGQPVRIDTVWGGLPRTEVSMTHFDINVELNESLFDMTPPEGYKVQSIDVDGSKPGEKDLIDAFQSCSEIGEGEFPETIETTGLTKLFTKYALARAKGKEGISDEQMQELMKKSFAIGRGLGFGMNLPESADAHYAGKGVKRDAKDAPIFWYKPEGAKKYRVIYADLTVRDADTAPQVAGARRIEKASNTSKSDAPSGK